MLQARSRSRASLHPGCVVCPAVHYADVSPFLADPRHRSVLLSGEPTLATECIAADYGAVKLWCPQSGQAGWHRRGGAEGRR
jgi:hypothetical protein